MVTVTKFPQENVASHVTIKYLIIRVLTFVLDPGPKNRSSGGHIP